MCLETVLFDPVAAVVVNRNRQEVVLDVRPFELFASTDKTACFELVAGTDTLAQEQPLGTNGRLVVQSSDGYSETGWVQAYCRYSSR